MEPRLDHPSVHTITLPTLFPVGPVNVYVVRGDTLVLFDTGPKMQSVYEDLIEQLRGIGLQLRDFDAIIATHGHLDHVGLLRRVAEESNATTYGHPFVVSQWTYGDEKAAQRRAYFTELFSRYGVPMDEIEACIDHWNSYRAYADDVTLDHAIQQGDTIFGFDVHHLPGHSPSDLVFVDPERGFSITGDHLLPDISPNPLMRKPLPGNPKVKSLVEYRESLNRCRELELGLSFPGHGKCFTNHRAVIDNLLARHDKRTEHVLALLRNGARTPYEICQALFPRLETPYLYLGISAAIGHLEVLEVECRAVPDLSAGRVRYRTAS